jgi:nitrogen fixation NifU-like protein
MRDLYREVILEEYKHPQNKGVLNKFTHTHHALNPLCGDEVTMYLEIEDGMVKNVSWEGKGCAISQASASLFSEHIKGKPVKEVEAMNEQTILDLLDIMLNPMRMKCAVLVMKTTANALKGEE